MCTVLVITEQYRCTVLIITVQSVLQVYRCTGYLSPEHPSAAVIPRAEHEPSEGLTQLSHSVILELIRTGADDVIRTASPDEVRHHALGELGVEVAGVEDGYAARVEVHAPLPILKLEIVQEELLADVVKPRGIAL